METINDNLALLFRTKANLRDHIEARGIDVGDALFEDYPLKIDEIKTGYPPRYTGHADVAGLKAIGWTDSDIEYYQQYGVCWNEEDDKYHKVPQDNIDLYGVINASNISNYKNILFYLPKIDTSQEQNFSNMFFSCNSLVGIPMLDTRQGTTFTSMFEYCYSLSCIPMLDTSKGIDFSHMFSSCTSLVGIPLLNISQAVSVVSMFSFCSSLAAIPPLDFSNAKYFRSMFRSCYRLISIPELNVRNVTDFTDAFEYSLSIKYPLLKNICRSIDLSFVKVLIDKESLIYIINNSNATTNITIKINILSYDKYSIDADVVTALSNKPFVALVK